MTTVPISAKSRAREHALVIAAERATTDLSWRARVIAGVYRTVAFHRWCPDCRSGAHSHHGMTVCSGYERHDGQPCTCPERP